MFAQRGYDLIAIHSLYFDHNLHELRNVDPQNGKRIL
jgi:hypothetical protein